MKTLKFLFVAVLVMAVAASCKKEEESCAAQINELRLNTYQVLGSHNSYHIGTYGPILQFMYDHPEMLPEGFNPDDWDYTHETLEDQLDDYGIRSLEIDVYSDPVGGLYYNRMGMLFIGESPESGEQDLLGAGLKVLHYPDVDFMTHTLTFKQALTKIRNWSEANPNHLPLVIQIQPKEENLFDLMGAPFTQAPLFDQAALESIDQEILDIFGPGLMRVITPDDVRKGYSTLNAAVHDGFWPQLGYARGKVLFVMDATDTQLAAYINGHPSFTGRAMFAFSEPGRPEAAFLKYDDPESNFELIQGYVKMGYMVRTRADADTREARSGETGRRDAAFACGAQIISTDYYRPDPRSTMGAGWTSYMVSVPGPEIARLNPVNGPQHVADCPIRE
ncbi:MAG: hypothetical protein EP344_15185 [Bacteroidetes bacterium]|nr:MAG: hypothetical protein EP344_15185 [Bacteroidota bacterium]